MPLLELQNIGKSFELKNLNKHIRACGGVSFALEEGEFVGITGKSGSGKSTILKMIFRSYVPYEGQIFYDSERFGKVSINTLDERRMLYLRKHEIAYVSQFLNVIPRTTAIDLVKQTALARGLDNEQASQRAAQLLQHFELDPGLWDSYPVVFSGGEKLRLNIARAMAMQPRLLLLDEPTASLDNASKFKVRTLLEKLKASGATMLGIFHDLEFMNDVCDREFELTSAKA